MMKGRLADGSKGLGIMSVVLVIYGSACVISFFALGLIMLPFFVIGIALIITGVFVLIPHEYIDKKVECR